MDRKNESAVTAEKDEENNDKTQEKTLAKSDKYSLAPQVSPGYRDFSQLETATVQSRNISSFPLKLHQILSNPDNETSITWQPHGRSWRLLEPEVFEKEIIPLYFRSNTLSSFKRQVSAWGFRYVSKGVDVNSYYHECFLRGLPHLCNLMRRLGKEQYQFWHAPYPQYVPDFYAINNDYPLPEQTTNATRNREETPAVEKCEEATTSKTDNQTEDDVQTSSQQHLDETKNLDQDQDLDQNLDQGENNNVGPAVVEQYSITDEEKKSESGQSTQSVSQSSQSPSGGSNSVVQDDNADTSTSTITINSNNALPYPNTNSTQNEPSVPPAFGTRNPHNPDVSIGQYSMIQQQHMPIPNLYCGIPQDIFIGGNMPSPAFSISLPTDTDTNFCSVERMNQIRMMAIERELLLRRQFQDGHQPLPLYTAAAASRPPQDPMDPYYQYLRWYQWQRDHYNL